MLKQTRPIRGLSAVIAFIWAGWMLHLGTIDRQRTIGLPEGWSEWAQHFVTFVVLGALVTVAVGRRPVVVFVALVLAGLVGEFAQLATPERTFSLLDVIPDALGAAVGVALALAAGGRRSFSFGAMATAVALMVATPWLLEETRFEYGEAAGAVCSDAPPAWTHEPNVVLEATDLDAMALPVRIKDPSAAELRKSVAQTDEFTLEAWFETSDLGQKGPARVFTISEGTARNQVNLHLGVEGDGLSVRFRTACELFRWVQIPDVLDADVPLHVVVTWSAGELITYVDAVEVSRVELPWGGLDSWDPTYRIRVGGEVGGGRAFVGEVFSVTMWDAALPPDDIVRRRQLGP